MRSSMKPGTSRLAVFHLLFQECRSDGFVGGILKSSTDSFFISNLEDTLAHAKLTWGWQCWVFPKCYNTSQWQLSLLLCAIRAPCTFPRSTICKNLFPGPSPSRLVTLSLLLQAVPSKKRNSKYFSASAMNEAGLLPLATHFYPFCIAPTNKNLGHFYY